jgi:hypothetical protein
MDGGLECTQRQVYVPVATSNLLQASTVLRRPQRSCVNSRSKIHQHGNYMLANNMLNDESECD